jgi:hypothetical protein
MAKFDIMKAISGLFGAGKRAAPAETAPASGTLSPDAETFNLITENGDFLVTENGDNLVAE